MQFSMGRTAPARRVGNSWLRKVFAIECNMIFEIAVEMQHRAARLSASHCRVTINRQALVTQATIRSPSTIEQAPPSLRLCRIPVYCLKVKRGPACDASRESINNAFLWLIVILSYNNLQIALHYLPTPEQVFSAPLKDSAILYKSTNRTHGRFHGLQHNFLPWPRLPYRELWQLFGQVYGYRYP